MKPLPNQRIELARRPPTLTNLKKRKSSFGSSFQVDINFVGLNFPRLIKTFLSPSRRTIEFILKKLDCASQNLARPRYPITNAFADCADETKFKLIFDFKFS